MINKKIILITIMLIGLFAISAVSAAENVTEETGTADEILNSEDSEIQSIENNEEKLEDNEGTFTDLNNTINGNSDPVVNLTRNYTYTEGDYYPEGIGIYRNVTINGNGHTIDAKGQTRIFWVDHENVTIKNITFKNGYTTLGGAIYWSGADGRVTDCNFINNTAGSTSGAIYWSGADGRVTDCNFINNTAGITSGAIEWLGNNGQVTDCNFINNTAKRYNGGAIFWSGANGTVTNSYFTKNTATRYGSAICYWYNSGSVSGCYFVNHTGNKGIIHYQSTTGAVNNNIFLNNSETEIVLNNSNVNTDYNWFGNNASDYNTNLGGDVTSWLFLNATANPNNPVLFNTTEAIFKLYLYNSTNLVISEYDNTLLRSVNLTVTTTKGKTDKNTAELGDTIKYNATQAGAGTLTASVENTRYTIELNNIKGQFKIDANITGAAEGDVKTDQNATVTIDITNIPTYATGEIVINVSEIGKNYTFTLPVIDNTVQLDIITTPGTYTLNAQYTGDENYNASNLVTKTFKVSNWNDSDLQDLIDSSTGNVALEHNYTFTNENATVNVNKSVTINGNGHTIDANGSSTALNITADNVSVDNVTVSNVDGTGILSNGTNTTLSNVELNNVNGTGILTSGDNATIANATLNNVTESGIISQGENATISNTEMNSVNGTAITTMGDNTSVSNTTLNNVNGTGIASSGANTTISNTEMNNVNGTGIVSVGENSTISNTSLSNVNGTGIDSDGPNTIINNTNLENVNGTVIQINGDNATVNNVTAANTTGALMNITGDNIAITNVNSTNNSTVLLDGKVNKTENITGVTIIPSIKATSSVVKNDVIVTATVSATEGNVTVQFQGKKYTVPLKDGKAEITIPNVGPGTYENVPVRYDGTSLYQNVSATTSFTSKAGVAENKDVAIDYLSGYKYTVRVMNADGSYSEGVPVKMTVNGVTYNLKTDANGYAKLLIELRPKTYTITTEFLLKRPIRLKLNQL